MLPTSIGRHPKPTPAGARLDHDAVFVGWPDPLLDLLARDLWM
jgi:hypothetical protein